MFVTVFYGVLHTQTGKLEYSNGGHNPPYVIRRTGAAEVLAGTGGTVLGILDDIRTHAKTATLRPGDMLFLYSDGVTEAMDGGGNLFSDARLQAVLEDAGSNTVTAVVRKVLDAVGAHAAGAAQSDDITVVAIRYHG